MSLCLFNFFVEFSSVELLSCVWLFATPWTTARQASLSITNSQSPPKPMSIKSVMPSNHLILCCPLLLLPSIFLSIRVFSNEPTFHIRWPKYWSFSFNISPSSEHPWLISFRMDWLDLLAVQGTLKSLQHHSSKTTILQCSAFFIVQLSHPYMTTGKTIAARVQPRQDPGDTLGMNGVGERERERGHVRPALIGPSLWGGEREREREREWPDGFAGSGRVWQCFIFYHGFYTLN